MQAVILAAGKSTRTHPLTLNRPKPLLRVKNESILIRNLKLIKDLVEEVIIVVGFKKELIQELVSDNFPDLNVRYMEQTKQLGTGHALLILKDHIKDGFILMLGDNLYSKTDVKKMTEKNQAILVKKIKNPENYGVVIEENEKVKKIIEKPKKFVSDLIICGLYSLDKSIFEFLNDVKVSSRGEVELTDALQELALNKDVYCVKSTMCHQISFPWDLLAADIDIRKGENFIDSTSKITGLVENSTIEGKCIIDGIVKNSIIMRNTKVSKDSIIENSIIGENVVFDGIARSSNNLTSIINGKEILVERFGTIIGDNAIINNGKIRSGCKVWPYKQVTGFVEADIK